MEDFRIPRQATHWELKGYKRKPGQPRKNWLNTVTRDPKDMGTTQDEAEELVTNRAEWHPCVTL